MGSIYLAGRRDRIDRVAGLCDAVPFDRRGAEAGVSVGDQFSEVQAGRVWKAEAGGRAVGFFIFDRVVGKHLLIDYAVALTPAGAVHSVEILQYRESYGGEIRSASWLAQFVGKTSGSPLKINGDIRNIAGATLSSTHVTEGVKRVLSAYGNRLR